VFLYLEDISRRNKALHMLKLSDKIKKDIDLEAQKALLEHVAWYSIVVTPTEKGLEHGTGVPIIYKGKYFVVTCKHVIKNVSPDKLGFIWRSNHPLIWTDKDKLKNGIYDKRFGCRKIQFFAIKNIYTPASIDLAIIELELKEEQKDLKFFEVSCNATKESQGNLDVLLMGHAGEIAIPVKRLEPGVIGYMSFLCNHWGKVTEYKDDMNKHFEEFDVKKHFLVSYEYDKNNKSAVHPKGMSGCGIWAWEKAKPNQMWFPDVKLVGIQSSFIRSLSLIKGINVKCLLELL